METNRTVAKVELACLIFFDSMTHFFLFFIFKVYISFQQKAGKFPVWVEAWTYVFGTYVLRKSKILILSMPWELRKHELKSTDKKKKSCLEKTMCLSLVVIWLLL